MFRVIVPWRPKPDRERAFAEVVAWYAAEFPDAVVQPVDTDDGTFNLARCRNTGVAAAGRESGADAVVVVNDADTLPERAALLAAVDAARTSGLVHLPYTRYQWLGADGTAQYRAGKDLPECDATLVHGACSGVYVTTPRTWAAHGGQDERFRGWGFEDAAWMLAHTALLGAPPQRHEGQVYALHHIAEVREGPDYDANAALMARYREAASAADSLAAMRDLVAGR